MSIRRIKKSIVLMCDCGCETVIANMEDLIAGKAVYGIMEDGLHYFNDHHKENTGIGTNLVIDFEDAVLESDAERTYYLKGLLARIRSLEQANQDLKKAHSVAGYLRIFEEKITEGRDVGHMTTSYRHYNTIYDVVKDERLATKGILYELTGLSHNYGRKFEETKQLIEKNTNQAKIKKLEREINERNEEIENLKGGKSNGKRAKN